MSKYLVVVDMQKDFIDGSLGSAAAQAVLPRVIDKIKNFSGTVVYTRDTHDEDYPETLEGKKSSGGSLRAGYGRVAVPERYRGAADRQPQSGI